MGASSNGSLIRRSWISWSPLLSGKPNNPRMAAAKAAAVGVVGLVQTEALRAEPLPTALVPLGPGSGRLLTTDFHGNIRA